MDIPTFFFGVAFVLDSLIPTLSILFTSVIYMFLKHKFYRSTKAAVKGRHELLKGFMALLFYVLYSKRLPSTKMRHPLGKKQTSQVSSAVERPPK